MTALAFLVLAGLGLAVFWSFMRRHRDPDRWPNNLIKASDTPDSQSTDTSWSPSTDALIVAGAVSLADLVSNRTDTTSDTTETTSSSWSEHGATGSWGESGEAAGGGSDSDGSDGGGSDGGGDSGGGESGGSSD